MKIVAIVQSRMGSSRLPGKMLMDLNGKPVIEHVFERLMESVEIDEFWLSTTIQSEDDALVAWANNQGIKCFRGSVGDVLERYYQTALKAKATQIVRITGDCPLLDIKIVDEVVRLHISSKNDYTSNNHPPTFPDGLDVEVFSFVSLEKAQAEARLNSEREHVTPYIWKNVAKFKIGNLANSKDLSNYRWTLDTKEDMDFIRLVVRECERLQLVNAGLQTILKILSENPGWQDVNKKNLRNQGYKQSLAND